MIKSAEISILRTILAIFIIGWLLILAFASCCFFVIASEIDMKKFYCFAFLIAEKSIHSIENWKFKRMFSFWSWEMLRIKWKNEISRFSWWIECIFAMCTLHCVRNELLYRIHSCSANFISLHSGTKVIKDTLDSLWFWVVREANS